MVLAVQRSFDDLGTPLCDVTFVVLDVETTGGSPATSSLTEVAAARYRFGELLGTYRTFVRPDERIPPAITALTGISDAMVADAPPIGAMLPSFLEFVGDGVVVGHNVRFDLSFLDHALAATGRDRLSATHASVDTLALARRLVRDEVHDCKLGTLADPLGLTHRPRHRALDDVLATGVYDRRRALADNWGVGTDPQFYEGMVTGLQELGLKRFHFVESTGYDTWEIRGFNDINERLGVEIGEPQRRPKHLRDGYAVNWAKVPDGVVFQRIPHYAPVGEPDTWILDIA